MTKKEAEKILDPETSRNALVEYDDEERIEAVNEACRVAVSALRAQRAKLDGSRLEGCWWCTGFCPEVTGDPHWDYRFCPKCGRPLTEEAWAEMDRRINDGTTD